MSDECRNDCTEPSPFPRQLFNRPALERIDYRIGTYADFRDALLRALNQNPVLANWTHREADDPGIALLEGASILGDILTFYQNLYANEAYLRTAQWRESVADLVKLLGYQLSPGVGGKATFAFEVKGDKPVVIPKGFPIKAQLEDMDKSAEFQTSRESIAYPHLSSFHIYRPRKPPQLIGKGRSLLEVDSVFCDRAEDEGTGDIGSIQSVGLKKGDRLILIPNGEILIVNHVEQVLDRIIVEVEGSLTGNYSTYITAYRIGRSFRHFGHNAPIQYTRLDNSADPPFKVDPTVFLRALDNKAMQYGTNLETTEIPLDTEVNDLATGNLIVCQGMYTFRFYRYDPHYGWRLDRDWPMSFTLPKGIIGARSETLSWANLSGPTTVLELDDPLWNQDDPIYGYPHLFALSWNLMLSVLGDIRRFRFHEVKSSKLRLRAPTEWEERLTDHTLNFWGTYDEALALVGRSLLLAKEGTEPLRVNVAVTREELNEAACTGRDRVSPWLWPVPVDKELDAFSPSDFDEQDSLVTAYGNLIEATQGKTEKEAVLGNGDNRETFQTFKIPKSPLTYFRSEEETPPEVPELEIYVNDRLWARVPSFFGYGPKAEIYIVREDADGNSWVQFGDGQAGARLPSGYQNVVARYRTGIGAYGPLQEGTTVQAGTRLDRLKKILLPGIVTGGDAPETAENAREAAPGKVQGLGRLVSLSDFENEALAIAGVSKAAAIWGLHNHVPAVVVTVLMESGRKDEQQEVQGILNEANQDRGAGRFPVVVVTGVRQYVYLRVTAGYDGTFRREILEKSIKEALGVVGAEGDGIDGSKGLFGIRQRRFGQPEYATRIEGTVQNVEGVVWARVEALGLMRDSSDDPLALSEPMHPSSSFHKKVYINTVRPELAERPMIQGLLPFDKLTANGSLWLERSTRRRDKVSPPANQSEGAALLYLHTAHFYLHLEEVDPTEVPSDA